MKNIHDIQLLELYLNYAALPNNDMFFADGIEIDVRDLVGKNINKMTVSEWVDERKVSDE